MCAHVCEMRVSANHRTNQPLKSNGQKKPGNVCLDVCLLALVRLCVIFNLVGVRALMHARAQACVESPGRTTTLRCDSL
jgi:hypothetical protein